MSSGRHSDASRLSKITRIATSSRAAYSTTRAAGGRLVQGVALLQVVSVLALVGQLLLVRSLLAELTTDDPDLRPLAWRAGLLVAAFAVASIATQAVTAAQQILAERVSAHSIGVVLDAASQTDLIEFEESGLHDRLQRALMNASVRPTQMTLGLVTVMSSLVTALAISVTVIVIAPLLFVIGIVAAVPLTFMAVTSGRAMFEFSVRQTANDRQRLYLQLLLTSRDWAKEVRAYRLGTPMLDRWRALYRLRLADLVSVTRRRLVRATFGALAAAIGLGGALYALLWMVTSGRLTVAAAAAVAAAMLLLSRQVQSLAAGIGNLYESALFVEDYLHFVAKQTELDATPRRAVTGPAFRSIRMKDVCFSYPTSSRPALDHVSLEVRAGEVVALVGENGSGKSTAAKLIAGLYEPTSGDLTWNDRPYVELDPSAVRGQVGVLFQDYIKFQMSVRENITLGRVERANPSEESVREAAEAAGADAMIDAMPAGYDTELGPQFIGGTELSGGQWQRLALARAAFRDSPVVVLDEPTAALDPIAEERLFNSTRRIFAGKSVLLISHRFSSVRLADRIYVLQAGRVVEVGTHESLMARDQLYAQMYRAQHQAFLGPVDAAATGRHERSA